MPRHAGRPRSYRTADILTRCCDCSLMRRMRGYAIDALAGFGERIVGTLGDVLLDTTTPVAVRRQIPRVLQQIPSQRSVDVLFQSYDEEDLTVRTTALKGLESSSRHSAEAELRARIAAAIYLEGSALLLRNGGGVSPFRDNHETPAARLLAATLDDRLRRTLERLFRLLGLKYPPKEMHAAYLALNRKKTDEYSAAIEFLDNVLERDLKRLLIAAARRKHADHADRTGSLRCRGKDQRAALRDLMRSGMPGLRPARWLLPRNSGCAICALKSNPSREKLGRRW